MVRTEIFKALREKREQAAQKPVEPTNESKTAETSEAAEQTNEVAGVKKASGKALVQKKAKVKPEYSKERLGGKCKVSNGKLKNPKKTKTSEAIERFRSFVMESKCTELNLLERTRIARMLLSRNAPKNVLEAFKSGDYETVAKFLGKKG